jgi:Na+-translocating ferredoxin:NAD+ oxidoreductase RnfG subunit
MARYLYGGTLLVFAAIAIALGAAVYQEGATVMTSGINSVSEKARETVVC